MNGKGKSTQVSVGGREGELILNHGTSVSEADGGVGMRHAIPQRHYLVRTPALARVGMGGGIGRVWEWNRLGGGGGY